jgi:hypothetical protein
LEECPIENFVVVGDGKVFRIIAEDVEKNTFPPGARMIRHTDDIRHGQIVDVGSRSDLIFDSLVGFGTIIARPQSPGNAVLMRAAIARVAFGKGHVDESDFGESSKCGVDFSEAGRKENVVVIDFDDERGGA